MAAAFIVTLGYPPEARFFPLIFVTFCGLVGLWELIKTYKQKVEETEEPDKGTGAGFSLSLAGSLGWSSSYGCWDLS